MRRARIAVVLVAIIGLAALLDDPTVADWLILAGILAAPLLAFLLYRGAGALRAELSQRRRDREYVRSGLAEIDEMAGVEFEDYVAARLRTSGWTVASTAASGDYGVDLVAQRDGDRVAIQCKRHGRSIGVSAVQQVVSGALHHDCADTMVVSNQEFTRAARQLADTHGCELVGRAELPEWAP